MEMARQFVGDNNGRLLASAAYLRKRGWKSADVISRAKRQLLEAGFIFETVKGRRPNKASWYAVTWQSLDKLPGYDIGVTLTFERAAYRFGPNGKGLSPSRGLVPTLIAPPPGIASRLPIPSRGAMEGRSEHSSAPSGGHHLEMPSPEATETQH